MKEMDQAVHCIKSGQQDGLEGLLKADPNLAEGTTDQGISLLQLAAYYRNRPAVQLLEHYKKNLNFFELVILGRTKEAEKFLSRGPQLLNSFSPDGFTPLGLACYFGQRDLVALLLQKGADPNLPSNNTFRISPLHSACAISDVALAELLLEHGADVNAEQQQGITPLHSAAHNGKTELVKLLLKNGADVHAKTEKGQKALNMAEEKGFDGISQILKEWEGNAEEG